MHQANYTYREERQLKKLIIVCVAILGVVSVSNARTFSPEGGALEPTHGYQTIADRDLVNDGSFEGGDCYDTPIWTCVHSDSDNCPWIVDLVPLGLWNYDGAHTAWIGGYCAGGHSLSICQEVDLGVGYLLSWFWMAYVNYGDNHFLVTIDGQIVYEYVSNLQDHLVGYEGAFADITGYDGVHTLCFEFVVNEDFDNYFVDFVELHNLTATEAISFSVAKSMY